MQRSSRLGNNSNRRLDLYHLLMLSDGSSKMYKKNAAQKYALLLVQRCGAGVVCFTGPKADKTTARDAGLAIMTTRPRQTSRRPSRALGLGSDPVRIRQKQRRLSVHPTSPPYDAIIATIRSTTTSLLRLKACARLREKKGDIVQRGERRSRHRNGKPQHLGAAAPGRGRRGGGARAAAAANVYDGGAAARPDRQYGTFLL